VCWVPSGKKKQNNSAESAMPQNFTATNLEVPIKNQQNL
jgi:hypothetical protein